MSDKFSVQGSYTVAPQTGGGSGFASLDTPILESMSLDRKMYRQYVLEADSVQAVDFAGLDQAEVLCIKTIGGRVRIRLTSEQGTEQSVPVDSFALIISESDPFTALDLLREPGIEVEVLVFLGQKA